MFRPSFDLSEYQRPESADYHAQWNGCTDLSPSFFENSVSYFAEEKKLYIQVSPVYEFETMFDLYEDLEYPIPENYQKEPTEQEVESWRGKLQEIKSSFVFPAVGQFPHTAAGFIAQNCLAESIKAAPLVIVAGDRSHFLTPFRWGMVVVLSLSATKTPPWLSFAR